MGGGGGSSGDSTTETFVRYAPYVEEYHEYFLAVSQAEGAEAIANSPYEDYAGQNFDDAIYGAGFGLASFPSIFDMFGKFMAGLDICTLFEQITRDIQENTALDAAVKAHATSLGDIFEQTTLPRYQEGMRDINAVVSSSYMIGKSILESRMQHDVAEFSADMKQKMIPVAVELHRTHLEWNKAVIAQYRALVFDSVKLEISTNESFLSYAAKDALWPFTVMSQERANLGALQGATSSNTSADTEGPSTTQSVVGGALGGAAMGGAIGGVPGAIGGAVIGGVAGIFM